ncbi:InlB B-repeat-containing protein, partial [Enterocloster citroniae]|uniref:InlB B-repeat-containing protein n=3 Tax=Enterocloster citroniae TaxID=358743 RepID=UPI0022E4783B
MEGRKRSRALSRTVYSAQKRLLAFLLAMAMILTNVGADMNTALAASSSESVTFTMSGSQLVKAIDEAIADGNEVTAEDLDFTNGKIAEFEKLFFGEGKIYEVFPDPEGGSMDAELRVFVRLPEDADDMYMVTGDEEIIFLYVNNGEDTISCTTEITRMDDGVEKVKKTKRVTVKSYEAAYGDEEVNHISKPAETPAPAPEDTNGPGAQETTSPSETESQVETTAPAADETTAADDTTEAPDETTSDETTTPDETQETDETQAALPEDTTEAPAESETEASTEEPATTETAEEKTQEATEPEKTEAPETEAPEPEATEPVASIIRHYAPVVADNENNDGADAAEVKEETEAPEPEKEEEPKETEAPTKEEATEAEQTEATEAPSKEESTEADQPTDPTDSTQASEDETTTAADGETTVPDTDETTTAPVESSTADESEGKAETPTQKVPDVASSSEAKPTQAPEKEDNVSAAGSTDLVGIGYCSTAKIYVTTINQLKALDDFEGYKISYAIYPEASARIVEGPRGVEEGQALTFGVKNQIGYAVENVTANGEILSVDSVADNDDGSQTAWYSVPEIYEEQEVEVYMTETGEHPEFDLTLPPMKDGMIIHIHADEGVLPAYVTAVASAVPGIEDAVKANVEADAVASGEEKKVISALSYNIDLLDQNGNKLDDQIWSGSVEVTFTGTPLEENSKVADTIEVMYVATGKENVPQANITANDVISVEPVPEMINVTENQVTFATEHFSIYTVVTSVTPPVTGDVKLITVQPLYENGLVAGETYKEEVIAVDGEYNFSYSVPAIEGYYVELAENSPSGFEVSDWKLTGSFSDNSSVTVTVIYIANAADYTVKHFFQNLDDENYTEDTGAEAHVNGKNGELTDAQPIHKAGFTVQRPIEQKEISADGQTVVNVYYNRNAYRLTYETDGGSYVPYQKGLYESKQSVAAGSEKEGYTFGGWYANPEGIGNQIRGTIDLISDITLYAKWTPTLVDYTIVYLIENADDVNYSYLTSSVKKAETGSTVTVKAGDGNPSQLDSANFTFKEASSAVVKPDGSTVIYVRYSRNEYTIWWPSGNATCGLSEHNHGSWCYDRRGNLTCRKTEHTHSDSCYESVTLSAKYGANITQLWKDTFNIPYPQHAWSFTNVNNDKFVNIDTMPSGNRRLYSHTFSTNKVQTLHYWLENYSGDGVETKLYNGVTYGLYKAIDVRFNYLYRDSEFYDIVGYTQGDHEGCTFGNSTRDGQQVHFYYKANSYALDLYGYNGQKISSNSVKIGTDLTKYLSEPSVPIEGAVFNGWYVDPEHTELNTITKMPAGLALYADWVLPNFTVTFMNQSEVAAVKDVEYDNTVEAPATPSRQGYIFTGWFDNEDGTGREFDPAMKFTSSAVYYAGWDEDINTTYSVHYIASNGDKIADDKQGSGVIGESILEKAIVPTGEFAGYVVDAVSKHFVLKSIASENVITFTYYAPGELSFNYTIQYVDDDGDVIHSVPNLTSEVNKITVYPDLSLSEIGGYEVQEGFVVYELSKEEDNIVIFHCISKTFSITYENVDGVTWGEDNDVDNPNPNQYTHKSLLGNPITLINPNKIGYVFTGWEYDENMVVSGRPHDEITTIIEYGSYGDLIFTANFEKDLSQKKTISYTVEHWVVGEQTARDTETVSETKWVNEPDTLTVQEITHKDYTGYKFGSYDPETLPETIAKDGVIKVNYVKDDSQTKTISYTVEHWVVGEQTARDTDIVSETKWVNEPDTLTVQEITHKDYTGYKFGSYDPETLPETIAKDG